MLTLPEIVEGLQDRRINRVARTCNLRIATVTDIRDGKTKNPSYDTVKRLSDYILSNGRVSGHFYDD